MCLTSCEGTLDDVFGEWSRPTPGGGGSSTIAVTSVTITGAPLRFDKNVLTAQTLTATVAPNDATDKTVTWESSDPTVATVDADGNVTPIKTGTVTIKATAGDKTATSTVYVYDKIVDISDGAASVTASESWLINGDGTAVANGITIGDGATVTLNGISITEQIICSNTGNSTIILADGSTNTVDASGINKKAGIQIGGTGTELTINAETEGTGILNATGGDEGAGIGTGMDGTGGNIVINGGTVKATGGGWATGIGTGSTYSSTNKCGTITINGGTVTATGGSNAAGIGTGAAYGSTNKCDAITIGTGVTSVTATKGVGSPDSIGKGLSGTGGTQTCGKIKFGTAEVFDGASTWDASINFTTNGAYGPFDGLNLNISTTTNASDTWTLTPVAP